MRTLDAPIVAAPEEVRADRTLSVVGPADDGLVDAETAFDLIRVSKVPVLAAGNGFTRSPRRIVVGIDFSETSLRIARLAVEHAGPNALIYLAHVISPENASRDAGTVGFSCRQQAADALLKICAQLPLAPGLSLHRILLQGDPATELVTFARNGRAELIAVGSHGHGFVKQSLVGSVVTSLLERSPCSVLMVPRVVASTRDGRPQRELQPER